MHIQQLNSSGPRGALKNSWGGGVMVDLASDLRDFSVRSAPERRRIQSKSAGFGEIGHLIWGMVRVRINHAENRPFLGTKPSYARS